MKTSLGRTCARYSILLTGAFIGTFLLQGAAAANGLFSLEE